MGKSYKYDASDDISALSKIIEKADALSVQMRSLHEEIMAVSGDKIRELERLTTQRKALVEPTSARCAMILQAGGTASDLVQGGVDPDNAHKMFRDHQLIKEGNPIAVLINHLMDQ